MPENQNYFLNNCVILWSFINQPLFNQTTLLNPFKFWQIYQIRTKLEKSWNYDTIKLLEKCCNSDLITLLERCLKIENEAN
jgi:hypothetical protein